jgi:hypothetical protein
LTREKTHDNSKVNDLEQFREDGVGQYLTTNQGLRVNDDQNSLTAGAGGPSLLEDFILRAKITHFDHERIPERVVHARGAAAHGYFQVYESMAPYTRAKFLQDPPVKTPMFVRFSTVVGSRGSSDLARDVRGFDVPGGEQSVAALKAEATALHFINEAYKHCKTIAATSVGIDLLRASYLGMDTLPEPSADGNGMSVEEGVIIGRDEQSDAGAAEFIHAIAQHRHWSREMQAQVPA